MTKKPVKTEKTENPIWFPAQLNWGQGKFQLKETTRERVSKLSFLDGRHPIETSKNLKTISISEAINQPSENLKTPALIFHTGFCCSTLLARCLDKKGVCMALKEPSIISTLSSVKPMIGTAFLQDRFEKTLCGAFRLLQQIPYPDERLLIKLSNFDNVLLPEILTHFSRARIIFTYQDLKTFLLSVAKGGRERRGFISQFFTNIRILPRSEIYFPEVNFETPIPKGDPSLYQAALVWKWQREVFDLYKSPNCRYLNCADFMENPKRAVQEVKAFMGLSESSSDGLETILDRHSKSQNQKFSSGTRQDELRTTEEKYHSEISEVLKWSGLNFPDGELILTRKIAV